jgi:GxxExxY protein
MTMRSKQWYPKTRKRAKSFSQVSSVASSDGLAGYQNHLSRRPVESSLPEAVIAFFASWRLGERKREATVTENAVAKEIVDAAFRVHTTLGPGLLESVYQTVLAYELGRRGLRAVSQQTIPVVYENVRIDTGFRADLVVEDKVIVEIKSVELLLPAHAAAEYARRGEGFRDEIGTRRFERPQSRVFHGWPWLPLLVSELSWPCGPGRASLAWTS